MMGRDIVANLHPCGTVDYSDALYAAVLRSHLRKRMLTHRADYDPWQWPPLDSDDPFWRGLLNNDTIPARNVGDWCTDEHVARVHGLDWDHASVRADMTALATAVEGTEPLDRYIPCSATWPQLILVSSTALMYATRRLLERTQAEETTVRAAVEWASRGAFADVEAVLNRHVAPRLVFIEPVHPEFTPAFCIRGEAGNDGAVLTVRGRYLNLGPYRMSTHDSDGDVPRLLPEALYGWRARTAER
jgi:hypothetical protein